MVFSAIIGHKEIIKTLEASLNDDRVGHAYLFLGPAGIGKKTLARAFARQLFCEERSKGEACSCQACRKFLSGSHPDFITVEPKGTSIKIEQIRDLKRSAYFRPWMGDSKVFFFPEAEQLTEAAANSFLKLLEEPPFKTFFLFTAERADYILPTIRSRCQIFTLYPVPAVEIVKWLQDQGFTEDEARKRASASQGLPGRALMENTAGPVRINFQEIQAEDLLHLLKIASDLEKKDRREILALLETWGEQIQTALLATCYSPLTPDGGNKTSRLVTISEKLTEVYGMVENNVNIRLALDTFFVFLKTTAGDYLINEGTW